MKNVVVLFRMIGFVRFDIQYNASLSYINSFVDFQSLERFRPISQPTIDKNCRLLQNKPHEPPAVDSWGFDTLGKKSARKRLCAPYVVTVGRKGKQSYLVIGCYCVNVRIEPKAKKKRRSACVIARPHCFLRSQRV